MVETGTSENKKIRGDFRSFSEIHAAWKKTRRVVISPLFSAVKKILLFCGKAKEEMDRGDRQERERESL